MSAIQAEPEADSHRLDVTSFDGGGERFLRQGAAMPADAADLARKADAVLFGSVKRPDVPEHVLVWCPIIGVRRQLDLAVNLRPVRAFPGVPTKVRDTDGVDLVIVRENTEGEYVGAGGASRADRGHDLGVEIAVYSRRVIERAAHHAFALAGRRSGYLCLVTNSNAMRYGHPLWDRVVREVGEHHPEVRLETVLVDAMAARVIPAPRSLDVLLISNPFGYPRTRPRLRTRHRREGRGESGGMHALGCTAAGRPRTQQSGSRIRYTVAGALRDAGRHTADLGGNATTAEVATAVLQTMESQGYDT